MHIFQSPEELAQQLANALMTLLGEHPTPAFHLAISGGKTPNLLFTVLAEKYAQSSLWNNVHFWWVDERMVSPEDPESNYGTVNKLLFSRITIPLGNIHRIKGENTPEAEAFSYSQQISERLPFSNGWPVFNLILLGMGDDGHTASIFPDQMHLLQSSKICEVSLHPQNHQKRVTLTGQAINAALKVWFVVTGSGKAERLKEIFSNHDNVQSIPAAHIKPFNGELAWYVDREAARKC